jgi:hypothetical protein
MTKPFAKFAAIASLALVLASCNQTTNVARGSGLALPVNGDCVTRNVEVFDRVEGEYVIVKQRFCGG